MTAKTKKVEGTPVVIAPRSNGRAGLGPQALAGVLPTPAAAPVPPNQARGKQVTRPAHNLGGGKT